MVLERYAGVQTVAFCGVFPEIGRAWASIDNSLFLWRYDRWCAALADARPETPVYEHARDVAPVLNATRDIAPSAGHSWI